MLYNPLSLSAALREAMDGKVYAEGDLYAYGGLWHSPMHHGDFSAPTAGEALARIRARLEALQAELAGLDALVLTWGTAWVYEDAQTGRIVGNCHKRPERCFRRRRLTVEEVTADWLVESPQSAPPGADYREPHPPHPRRPACQPAEQGHAAAGSRRAGGGSARCRGLLPRLRTADGRAARLPLLCGRPGASGRRGGGLRVGALLRRLSDGRGAAGDGRM